MFKKWSAYSLRARGVRQKYFTLLQQKVNAKSSRMLANTRRRIIKGFLFGSAAIATYYFCNEMYSEHLEKKKMKKKLMKAYPSQTYIISFQEDPMELLREVEIKSNAEEQEVNPLENKHCILITQQNEETKLLQEKLGKTVIIFSPKNLDQLCHVIERCHKYRHTAIVGHYPMPEIDILPPPPSPPPSESQTQNRDHKQLLSALKQIDQPINKNKYVVVDLSLFKGCKIDQVNEILEVDAGALCGPVNQELMAKGWQPLFEGFCDRASVYEVVVNNLPLRDGEGLANSIENLSLVSAEGKRFKSSTEVQKFGQIPNLTSLFVGTGGVFAVPAKINLKIFRKPLEESTKTYEIQSDNVSDLVVKWRQIRQYLSSKRQKFLLRIASNNRLIIQTDHPLTLPQDIGYTQIPSPSQLAQQISHIFSINPKILQKILLSTPNPSNLIIQNNLLQVPTGRTPQQIRQLISDVSLEGGVLVWCRDRDELRAVKERIDILQVGAELMKKIVEVREGIDKRQVLYSHPRYEKYFAKGYFRKMTEFFW